MRNFLFLILFFPSLLFAQNIDHWETLVQAESTWSYLLPTVQPQATWNTINFSDTSWLSAQGGMGYGDGDDNTIIANTNSLYLRKEFNVVSVNQIESIVFNMDFDDAFVSYLNGVEIARANIGVPGDIPLYTDLSSGQHEALMYQGAYPNTYNLDLLNTPIQNGINVLGVEVHNATANSSDLTALPYLHLGVNVSNVVYGPAQNWFNPPFVFTSTNLPIVKINTNSQAILDDPRIVAEMDIINNASGVNFLNDPSTDYDGRISIEKRGSSSQSFPKKSFALETQDILGNNNNVSLLGMPSENDWILHAPYSDKSLMRNVITFELGRRVGRYTPRTEYCELFINDVYQGVYVLMENIKRDKNRVDIANLLPTDLAGDELTGGYILKIDKYTGGFQGGWVSPYTNLGGGDLTIQYHKPEFTDLAVVQRNYIQNHVTQFESALYGNNFTDSLLGYEPYIDVSSFMDLYLINELSKNIDGYRLSTYFYKQKDSQGGKIVMGPWWDYNLTYGNADYCDGANTEDWESQTLCGGNNPFWFERLLEDDEYRDLLKCKWLDYRANQWSDENINLLIDSIALYLDEAQTRNFETWNILGNYVWPNAYVGNTYEDEIDTLNNWTSARLDWIDTNLEGLCSYGCTDPNACNYSQALSDDGSCIYAATYYDCFGNCLNDSDGDFVCDELDNCPNHSNPDQMDVNANGIGDVCEDLTSIIDLLNNADNKLLKIVDLSGRELGLNATGFVILVFEDGSVEKRFVFSE